MKTTFRIIASLLVLGGLAACQQFKIDTQVTPEQAAGNIRLVCDALPTYSVPAANPGNVSFNITANTPWTVTRSSGADWCEVSPASSSESALISDVTVSFEPNTGEDDRSVTLTVRGENLNKTVLITITQDRHGKLFVTPVAQDFAATGGPLNFSINTNKEWQIVSSEGWLSFNRDSGQPDPEGRTITIVAIAEQSSVLERTATVTVMAGDDEESFEVTQKAKFELAELTQTFPGAGGSQQFRLRTDLPWEVNSDKAWLSFDKEDGVGDGHSVTITATAQPNDGISRKAIVSVVAGGSTKSFEVLQQGANFQMVAPASTTLDRKGAELTIEVKASMAWEPETSVDSWTVTKLDDSHFKLVAPFNGKFKDLSGTVAIVNASGARDEITFTQAMNFELSGHYEVLEDGSLKVYCDDKTRATLVDEARYVSFVMAMGDVNFDDTAEFVCSTHDAGGSGELQCQIRLGAGKKRLRTNGGTTAYNTADIDISVAELNAIKEYRMDFRPNAEDAASIDLEFFYNGTSKALMTSVSPYSDPAATGHYFFGCESAAEGSGTWYVVKSCSVSFIAE